MNAILHLIEAYTELYKADHNEEVAERLKFQLGQMRDIVYTPETNALKVFFDTKFDLVGDLLLNRNCIMFIWWVMKQQKTLAIRI